MALAASSSFYDADIVVEEENVGRQSSPPFFRGLWNATDEVVGTDRIFCSDDGLQLYALVLLTAHTHSVYHTYVELCECGATCL